MAVIRTTICVILVMVCSRVFAQDYEIRMERPEKAGVKYELTASGSESEYMTMSDPNQVIKEGKSSISGELKGLVTILETDEMMRESKIKLTVSRCAITIDGKDYENNVLTKGTEIIALLDKPKETFLIDNKPVPEEIGKFLSLFFTTNSSVLTDDDVFGTKERKKVGDSWPVNSTLAAKDLTGFEMPVAPEDVKGSTKLEKLVDVDGIKCLYLRGKLQINNMTPPLPPGFTIDLSNMTALFSGEFPVDTSIIPLSRMMTMTVTFSGKGKQGSDSAEVKIYVEQSQTAEERYKLLK
jgi:hypothetical protein